MPFLKSPRRSIRAMCLGVWICCALGAAAQSGGESLPEEGDGDLFDISLDELTELTVGTVQGASKHEQKTTEAPASVTVLDSEEIQRYGYRTLSALLQSVRGFHVSSDRNYSFLGTRGVNQQDYNSHVLILVNGHRINHNLSDGGLIDTAFPIDVDLIERVEVVRGPGSVLYGNNAFFGVINVVTKRGRDFGSGEVSGAVASFETYSGRVSYGTRAKNGVEFLLSGTYLDSAGEKEIYFPAYDLPIFNNGIARRRDDEYYGSLFGMIQWKDFTLQGAYINRDRASSAAPLYSVFNHPRSGTAEDRSYVDLKFEHQFPDDLDFTALVYYDRYGFDSALPYGPPFTLMEVVNRVEQIGEWWGSEVRVSKKLFDVHRLSLGTEYRDDFRQEAINYDEDPYEFFTHLQRDRTSVGVYLEGEFRLWEPLMLHLGGRYDDYSGYDPTVSPRAALVYNPFGQSTFKAIYGTAFRTPNFRELADSRIAPGVATDEITSYELAYEQGYGKNLRSTVNLHYSELGNLLAISRNFSVGDSLNLDARVQGAEFGLDGVWENGVRTRFSYAVQRAEDTLTGRRLADSPQSIVKANVSVPVWKQKVFAGLEAQYTSDRVTFQNTEADGFALFHFTLFSQELLEGLDLSASVYNLFDKDYSDPASWLYFQDVIPRPGRMFRLKAVYRF
jgi:outer membrane receptor for ferrienterochelin and colicins